MITKILIAKITLISALIVSAETPDLRFIFTSQMSPNDAHNIEEIITDDIKIPIRWCPIIVSGVGVPSN